MISVMLAGVFTLSPAISSLMSNVVINNVGQISATTVFAKSGYWRDIQDAVNQAATYGIANVRIPEGTFNFVNVGESWTGARVIIPAGISLFGAPTERYANDSVVEWNTILKLPWDMPNNDAIWFRFGSEGESVSKFTRFSDIKLVGYRYYDNSVTHRYDGIRMQNILDFRVDHSCLQDVCGNGITASGDSNPNQPESHYMIRGVIDHCILVNTVGVVAPYDSRTVGYGIYVTRGGGYLYQGWESDTTKVLGNYLNYTVFVENCYLEKWRHCVVSRQGAHVVLRYSTIKYDYAYGSVDMHGDYAGRAIEIYNCTIRDAVTGGQDGAVWIRGSSGVAFNNTVGGGVYNYFIMFSNENPDPTFWVHDWWVWNNTMLSGCTEITEYDPNNNINEGVDYFRYAPSWYTPYPYPHPLTLWMP